MKKLTKSKILQLFEQLTVWKRGGERAPHKPLLVLYALGRCLQDADRLTSFSVIDPDLRELLIEFGPQRRSYHTEYPFWRLQNDGIWELTNTENVQARKSNTDANKSDLVRYDVHGGFTKEVYRLLNGDKPLVVELARSLLDANFPQSVHEDILQAVGIDLEESGRDRNARDPDFRERVLRAYEFRCAVCNFDIRLGRSYLALEAAHIKWHQAGGPDIEKNGLALCAIHHKMFDLGAFTLTESLDLVVSERAHGNTGFDLWLMAFHGRPIRGPIRNDYFPDRGFTRWHREEVFKNPFRELP